MAPTSLQSVLADAESDLAQAMSEANASVTVEGPLPMLLCDRGPIREVLQNLLANAVKYRHPHRPPRSVVSAGEESAGADGRRGAMLRISVMDNGIGIENRHAARIFEPFQRLHGADSDPGSGMGLALCRKIVDRHGGAMGADGRPGRGATVWFTLPAAPSGPAP